MSSDSVVTPETGQEFQVTVVIVCHNDGRWLPRCLESLRTQTIAARMEVIVVDNASEDGTDTLAQKLMAGWPNARFLPTGGDHGFAVACNRGAQAARGRYLYLLSPDTWLEPDCLEQFHLAAEREQASGAGCTILEYEDDTVQAKGSDGFDFTGYPVVPRDGGSPQPLFCVSGFSFLRRDVFFALGQLDEKMFMYCEETDLAWRVWLSGGKLVSAPAARLHHRGAALVNPAGGTRIVENRTSVQKRFLANRNCLLVLAKNCQHVLLLMLLPCAALVLAESVATLMMTRSWSVTRATCLDALLDVWRLRRHVFEHRRRVKALRRHGDFWMLRFFRLGFGRHGEIGKMIRMGFPKINRH